MSCIFDPFCQIENLLMHFTFNDINQYNNYLYICYYDFCRLLHKLTFVTMFLSNLSSVSCLSARLAVSLPIYICLCNLFPIFLEPQGKFNLTWYGTLKVKTNVYFNIKKRRAHKKLIQCWNVPNRLFILHASFF